MLCVLRVEAAQVTRHVGKRTVVVGYDGLVHIGANVIEFFGVGRPRYQLRCRELR